MAFGGFKNDPADTLHTVLGFNGLPMTGQAAELLTELFDPLGAASSLAVTVVEVGTTGRYTISFTPDEVGIWLLRVTDPPFPASAGAVSEYTLEILPRVLFRPRLYAGYRNSGNRAYLKR